ncbi:MAG: Citrate lyase subunit beta [Alphaproteobacteria bacterium MarineAlpha9_Bin3]|nr:MAG: Citrate lyase subunit beta [Alphaproteobacteria bacterium MarineAlpha9_Bin3]|tara:strand:+ start:1603 stop:2451 length:849 start_codon:yes stop_codon:yes gene_type:complete
MTDNEYIQKRRSFIFCPGNKPDMIPKALSSGADMVCIDLEDAIIPDHKDISRLSTIKAFENISIPSGVETLIRINDVNSKDGKEDIKAILNSSETASGLMLPKIQSVDEVIDLENQIKLSNKDLNLHIIIETNKALENAWNIAHSSPLIKSLLFGGVDMSADLGCNGDWMSLLYARSRVVHAAAGAGLDAIDVPFLNLEDMQGMQDEAQKSKNLGFSGKGSIHPKQIAILNNVFTPSEEEVEYANKVINAFRDASDGLVVVDGKLIEKPVLRTVLKIIANSK